MELFVGFDDDLEIDERSCSWYNFVKFVEYFYSIKIYFILNVVNFYFCYESDDKIK